jgi:ABC-type uncharacterized transport system fused permease/ATPase subunit
MSMKKRVLNRLEVFDKIITLFTAALGFVAALAWNEAAKSLFSEGGVLHFLAKYGVWVYAVVVTMFAFIITIWLTKISQRIKKDDKPK